MVSPRTRLLKSTKPDQRRHVSPEDHDGELPAVGMSRKQRGLRATEVDHMEPVKKRVSRSALGEGGIYE